MCLDILFFTLYVDHMNWLTIVETSSSLRKNKFRHKLQNPQEQNSSMFVLVSIYNRPTTQKGIKDRLRSKPKCLTTLSMTKSLTF